MTLAGDLILKGHEVTIFEALHKTGGVVVDLREVDEGTRDFRRTIVKTLDPNEYNINVAEFLM